MLHSIKTNKQALVIFTLIFAPFFFVHGQAISTTSTDSLQSNLSRLTESLDLLNAIKAGKRITDATPLQTALNDVMSISEEEVRGVSARLMAQNKLTDEETALRENLMTSLASLSLHLKSVRIDTTQESGISSVISIAQKLKEWRDGVYAVAMAQAVQFVSILENEDSIKAANARLALILKDEKKIRGILPASKTAPFMRLIKKAQGEIKKATDLNTRAKSALMPDTEKSINGDVVDEMIRQSNKLVNDAYEDFIAMSRLIKK